MAIVSMVSTHLSKKIVSGAWNNLGMGDTGAPFEIAEYSDKTVHIFGTFGAGGTIEIDGSNDPRVLTDAENASWFTLADPQGFQIVKSADSGEAILENPRFMRPKINGGDETTNITVTLCARGA